MRLRWAHLAVVIALLAETGLSSAEALRQKPVLVLHGGAGTLLRSEMTAEVEQAYRAAIHDALRAGWEVLRTGGSSLDAVERSIRMLEDVPLFNAGKGAVFTHDGRNEMDAAIMDGATRRAGAVAAVTVIRNPISAARAVMEKSPHVMMTGRGAELFATSVGLEVESPEYFWTEKRWEQLQKELVKEREMQKKTGGAAFLWPTALSEGSDHKFGTVGVVALDANGRLAAGTSTGGTTNKRFGRVGDSPIIGAGTYANELCAVSATGHGEYFIRYTVAHDICALVEYKGMSVADAADLVVNGKLKQAQGDGGVIVLDRSGRFALTFNTPGMYRGYIAGDGVPHVAIFRE